MGFDPSLYSTDRLDCPEEIFQGCFTDKIDGSCPLDEDGYEAVVNQCGKFRTLDRGAGKDPRYCHYIYEPDSVYEAPGGCQYYGYYRYWCSTNQPTPPSATSVATSVGGFVNPQRVLAEEYLPSNYYSWCSCHKRSDGTHLYLLIKNIMPYFVLLVLDNPPHLQHIVSSVEKLIC
jgi:hypothetical protein